MTLSTEVVESQPLFGPHASRETGRRAVGSSGAVHNTVRHNNEMDHPWRVWCRFKGGSYAGVSPVGDEVLVFAGDSSSGRSGAMARLARDGSASLQCQQAPQALYCQGGEPHLVPSVPGLTEAIVPGPDDVLVLCSAEVLEYLPRGYGFVLPRLGTSDAEIEALLAEVLSYAEDGAAAVIRRLARP